MINKERILTSVSWENMSWFTAMRETQTETDPLVQTVHSWRAGERVCDMSHATFMDDWLSSVQ